MQNIFINLIRFFYCIVLFNFSSLWMNVFCRLLPLWYIFCCCCCFFSYYKKIKGTYPSRFVCVVYFLYKFFSFLILCWQHLGLFLLIFIWHLQDSNVCVCYEILLFFFFLFCIKLLVNFN